MLEKRSRIIDANITNRIQKIKERLSGAEDAIENINTTVKENTKNSKLLTENMQDIQYTMRTTTLRKTCTEESEDNHLKKPLHIFNKKEEEKFPNLKRERMP